MKTIWIIFLFLFSVHVFAQGSIYDLETSWKNAKNETIKFSEFQGKPVVLAMVYTSCPHTCPLIVEKLREIYASSGLKEDEIHLVLMTFDPEVDTPEILSQFKAKKNIHQKNWNFLQGSLETTRIMSVLLNVSYQKDEKTGVFTHDNKIFLIDPKGEMIETLSGLDQSIQPIIQKLSKRKSLLQKIKSYFKNLFY